MAYQSTTLSDSPALYWRCSEDSGPDVADASGNGRTGTATDGVTFAQRGLLRADANTALALDGATADAGAAYQAAVLADSPLAYWPLAEAGVPFADASGGGYALTSVVRGTITPGGPAPFAGSGASCSFTGSGSLQSAGAPAGVASSGAWSAEGWVYAALPADSTFGLWFYYGALGGGACVAADASYDALGGTLVECFSANGAVEIDQPPRLGWHHVCFTGSGGVGRGYVDGVLVTPLFSFTFTDSAPSSPLFSVGDGPTEDWGEPWVGSLAHVAFYATQLSAERVGAHYAAAAGAGAGTMVVQDATSTRPAAASIELWLQTTTTQGGVLAQFATADGTSRDLTLYLRTDGVPAFRGGDTEIVRSSDRSVADGRIHHLVATLDGDAAAWLYVDGSQVAHGEGVTPASPFTGRWQIGAGTTVDLAVPPASAAFAGTLDEVAIYVD